MVGKFTQHSHTLASFLTLPLPIHDQSFLAKKSNAKLDKKFTVSKTMLVICRVMLLAFCLRLILPDVMERSPYRNASKKPFI